MPLRPRPKKSRNSDNSARVRGRFDAQRVVAFWRDQEDRFLCKHDGTLVAAPHYEEILGTWSDTEMEALIALDGFKDWLRRIYVPLSAFRHRVRKSADAAERREAERRSRRFRRLLGRLPEPERGQVLATLKSVGDAIGHTRPVELASVLGATLHSVGLTIAQTTEVLDALSVPLSGDEAVVRHRVAVAVRRRQCGNL